MLKNLQFCPKLTQPFAPFIRRRNHYFEMEINLLFQQQKSKFFRLLTFVQTFRGGCCTLIIHHWSLENHHFIKKLKTLCALTANFNINAIFY